MNKTEPKQTAGTLNATLSALDADITAAGERMVALQSDLTIATDELAGIESHQLPPATTATAMADAMAEGGDTLETFLDDHRRTSTERTDWAGRKAKAGDRLATVMLGLEKASGDLAELQEQRAIAWTKFVITAHSELIDEFRDRITAAWEEVALPMLAFAKATEDGSVLPIVSGHGWRLHSDAFVTLRYTGADLGAAAAAQAELIPVPSRRPDHRGVAGADIIRQFRDRLDAEAKPRAGSTSARRSTALAAPKSSDGES